MELDGLVDFQGTAEWRRQKAEQYSEDTRNVTAASMLQKLADEASLLEGSEAHETLIEAFTASYEASADKDTVPMVETISDDLRAVGFGYSPASAETFIRNLCQR